MLITVLAKRFPTFSEAECATLSELEHQSPAQLQRERESIHALLLAPDLNGFERQELVAVLTYIDELVKRSANVPSNQTFLAERGAREFENTVIRVATLRRDRGVSTGKLTALKSPETQSRAIAHNPLTVANEVARILQGTLGMPLGRLGPQGVVVQLILPQIRPLTDTELLEMTAKLLERHPREVPLLIELMNHPDFRAYVLGRRPFYDFVVKHWELSAVDVISFLGGVGFGIVTDMVETARFFIEMTRIAAHPQQIVIELIPLAARGRMHEAAELLKGQIAIVVEAIRAIWHFLGQITQWPDMASAALQAKVQEFNEHLSRFEFFDAGKMIGPIIGLIVTLTVAALRSGVRLGKALFEALPNLRFTQLAHTLDVVRMRKILEAFRDTLTTRARALAAQVDRGAQKAAENIIEAFIPGVGTFGLGIGPEEAFVYVTSASGGAIRRAVVTDFLDHARGLVAMTVKLGDETFAELIGGIEELFDVQKLLKRKGPSRSELHAIEAAELEVAELKKIYERIADVTRYTKEELNLIVRYLASLEQKFPKLKDFKLRPIRRPKGGSEPIWFERMHMDQSEFGFGGRWPDSKSPPGRIDFQLDGLMMDGSIGEAKFSALDPRDYDSFRRSIEIDEVPTATRSSFELEPGLLDEIAEEVPNLDPRIRQNTRWLADRMGDMANQFDRLKQIAEAASLPGVEIAANTEELGKLIEALLRQRYGDRHFFTIITPSR